jgi:hypothetical protein
MRARATGGRGRAHRDRRGEIGEPQGTHVMTSLSTKSKSAFASESLAKTDRSLLLLPRRPGPRLTPNIPMGR